MNNLFLFCCITLLISVTSCKKNSDSNPAESRFISGSYSDFFGYYNQLKEADISYHFFTFSGVYDKPEDDISNVAAQTIGNNEPNTLIVDNKILSFVDYEYHSDVNASISYVDTNMTDNYGKKYDLEFKQNTLYAKSDGSIENPIDQVYIPKLLYPVTYENLTQDGKLTDGTIVKWTADSNNLNGIVITIEYYPNSQSDSLNRINYPEHIKRSTKTEDSGVFTFSESDFIDFPGNADLSFEIAREGFTNFIDKSENKCSYSALVITVAGFTISIPVF